MLAKNIVKTNLKQACYHCGEDCLSDTLNVNDRVFCCVGCKTVYEIINKVELCEYYDISRSPGLNQKETVRKEKFAFLEDKQIEEKLIHFKDSTQSHVTFYLPQMHCSSCIWLLEHMPKINKAIVRSQVNFLKKEVNVVFHHKDISLRKVAEILTSIGYEPHLSLNDLGEKKNIGYDKKRIYKIGITGFCFGNIMLMSFPEYFSIEGIEERALRLIFSYLNLALSLPVFFYGASSFFVSAFQGIKQKFLNIDAPIALAILITFVRSVYEITTQSGAGYLDSMTGIVFFMLIGRFFQDKTYNTLSFQRDYTSYFPLSVTVVDGDPKEKQVAVSKLKVGDRIKIHSNEIIPADSILFYGNATIDYSFVSGESIPVEKTIGEIVYAGGKQLGGAIEMEVVKEVSQSYLTQLWNNNTFQEKEPKERSYIHSVSRYFTFVLLSIATVAATYWYFHDPAKVWSSVTAVLIVACPCALLLSATFTNGNMLRALQKAGLFAKNADVIERIAQADTIVFDKTGTITQSHESIVTYCGKELDNVHLRSVKSLVAQSSHPLSRSILKFLPGAEICPVKTFEEKTGEGIKGTSLGKEIMIGSQKFVNEKNVNNKPGTNVYLKIDGELFGVFSVQPKYREDLATQLLSLNKLYKTALLSGDNSSAENTLRPLFNSDLLFNQSPQNKLDYIKELQKQERKVIMLGDGLNDAGALKQSDAGIALTDHINNFSPACDAIMTGESFNRFNQMIDYCKRHKTIINTSFVVSIIYNIIGLSFAVQGDLKPVIAAILMPVSSVSIILLTTGMSSLFALSFKKTTGYNKIEETDKDHIGY